MHRASARAKLHRDLECWVMGEHGVMTPKYSEEPEQYLI